VIVIRNVLEMTQRTVVVDGETVSTLRDSVSLSLYDLNKSLILPVYSTSFSLRVVFSTVVHRFKLSIKLHHSVFNIALIM